MPKRTPRQRIIDGFHNRRLKTDYAEYRHETPRQIWQPLLHLFPRPRTHTLSHIRLLDIGAGFGGHAKFFAARFGYDVVAVEPASKVRNFGRRVNAHPNVRWADDFLPHLHEIRRTEKVKFDIVTLSTVWNYVAQEDRQQALEVLGRMVIPGGNVAVVLPDYRDIPDDSIDSSTASGKIFQILEMARECGFSIVSRRHDVVLKPAPDNKFSYILLQRQHGPAKHFRP